MPSPTTRGCSRSLDDRAVLLAVLEDPPAGLAELRAVLLADYQWRLAEGLD